MRNLATTTLLRWSKLKSRRLMKTKNTTTKKKPKKIELERDIRSKTDLLDMSLNRQTINNMTVTNALLSEIIENGLVDNIFKRLAK